MSRICLILMAILSVPQLASAQRLKVSDNHRFLVTESGEPFFWLGDTAWELLHRCDRDEVDLYLETRATQGFNVVHAVALAELDGLNDPNPYGELPLFDQNPETPNPAYFEHVDYVLDKAASLGMYIALLPTWGDKLFTNSWGKGPEVFNRQNANAYGEWIGKRYRDRENIIWVIGGDRNPRSGSDDVEVWRALAEGVVEGVGGYDNALMTYHPQPTALGGSSSWFHNDRWLDFNMHQTGHCADKGTYRHIQHDYQLTPIKPVLDGEPLYEDHPHCFNAKELGYSVPSDIRRIMYWNVFAGAFGQSYGCHDVWQMYKNGREGINGPLRPWPMALDLPMANQAKHIKDLMLSRPFLTRIPDQSMVNGTQEDTKDYVIATRDSEGTYGMVYFPTGKGMSINLTAITGIQLTTHWYDPRTGAAFEGPTVEKSNDYFAQPPSMENDWVLVIDAENQSFDAPGR